MLARLTAIVAATAALSLGIVAPADAAVVGIDQCDTTSPANTSTTCVFIGTPGTFTLDLNSGARYAWAEATCSQGGSLYVNVWDYEGGYDWDYNYLYGGLCTLVVSAGAGGSARGYVDQ